MSVLWEKHKRRVRLPVISRSVGHRTDGGKLETPKSAGIERRSRECHNDERRTTDDDFEPEQPFLLWWTLTHAWSDSVLHSGLLRPFPTLLPRLASLWPLNTPQTAIGGSPYFHRINGAQRYERRRSDPRTHAAHRFERCTGLARSDRRDRGVRTSRRHSGRGRSAAPLRCACVL